MKRSIIWASLLLLDTLVLGSSGPGSPLLSIAVQPARAQAQAQDQGSGPGQTQDQSQDQSQSTSQSNSQSSSQNPDSAQNQATGGGGNRRQMWANMSPEKRARLQKFLLNRRAAQGGSGQAGQMGQTGQFGQAGQTGQLGQMGQMRQRGQMGRGGAGRTAVDTEHVNLKSDVAYGKDPLQKIDVYTPKNAPDKPMPILIFFHGGGWSRGDKAQGDHAGKGNSYTAKNIILVSGNYRLAPNVMHPKEIEDVAAAVAYVKAHAAEYGADPNRIYVMGHSAGAHLVDLLGTNEKYLAANGLSFKDIKGVISLDTASLNLSERLDDNSREIGLVGPMIDAAFGSDAKVLADASPTLNIHKGKKYPPFLMFCGERRKSCVEQHDKFSRAMKEAGGEVVVKPVPLNHGEINRAAGQPDAEIFKDVVTMISGDK